MIVRERFPISELQRRTGVPPATVHHYLKQGILPPARRSVSNRFLYDERHVLGLRLIRTLRERRGLSLKVIRSILPVLLGLAEAEAFRPEMWDQVMGQRGGRGARTPATRLLEAAVEAFSRRGYGDVNVDEICKTARMAKGSFYRHYRSKEDLFFAAAEAAAVEVGESFVRSMPPVPGLSDGAEEILARALERRLPVFLDLFARAAQRRPGYPAVARRLTAGLAFRIGEGIASPEPQTTGRALLQAALVRAIWETVEPAPLPLVREVVAVQP